MPHRHAAAARRAAFIALLTAGLPTNAFAQAPPRSVAPSAPAAARPAQGAPDPYASDLDTAVSEVVVTGSRTPPGSVVGDIKPELTLSPSDIQSYGVSTLTELLDELAPETRSDRGRSSSGPVVLLNGRRISGFQEIRDIPVEAIQRVEILPEEVALKYGYTADQRVVNVVLRRFFRAWTAEGGAGGATEGGVASGSAEADLFHVFRDQRLNLDLKVNGSSGLKEDGRDLVSASAQQPFALTGNVTSTTPGGLVDPALSPTATIAGVPASVGVRPLTLADFAGTAGIAAATDARPYRSLVPEKESVALNGVLARPMPFGFNGTINGTLEASRSYSLQGLAGYALDVPAGDPFSPFGQDVLLSRYAGDRAQTQEVRTWTAHLGAGATRDLAKWHLTFTGAYDHGDTRTASDLGVDTAGAQALLDARSPGFDPFRPLPTGVLTRLGRNEASQVTDSANLQALAAGPLTSVPAGQLYASFKAGDAPSFLSSSSTRGLLHQDVDLSRNDFNAQANLDLPLASRARGVLPWLGSLSVSGDMAVDAVSDAGTLLTYGEGINWTPFTGWNVILSHTHDENAPSVQQLGAPLVATTSVRVFDYVTGRTVDVTSLSGGNPALVADSREVTKLGLTFKPVSSQDLTLQANWIRERIDNPVESFPAVTPEIAAAFPDRFVRDASGELVSIDNRPVNFARSDREELRYGFNYSRPLGPQPKRPEFGRRRQRDEAEDQKRRVAAQNGQDGPPPGPPDDGGGPPPGGGGFGGRGGGRGGFGGGGPRGGFGPGGRLQFALYHTVIFTDQLLVRPGGPVLDLLNGSAAGSTGGTPQHEIEAQAGFSLKGFGARLSADWKSGTTVRGASTLGDLTFSDLATVNLRLFDDFTQQAWALKALPWLRGSRLTVGVTNLFDERIHVADARGVTPIGYQPAYLDPTGRTIRIQFRKLFFTPPSAADRERMRALFRRNDTGGPAIPPPEPGGGEPPPPPPPS